MNKETILDLDLDIRLDKVSTLKNIVSIKENFSRIYHQANRIIIDGSGVDDADFSLVQLIVSVAVSAKSSAKQFELRNPAPCIGKAFARAGLAGFAGVTDGV